MFRDMRVRPRPRIKKLDSLTVIQAAFNQQIDAPRLMALVSPTCPFCLAGSDAVIDLAATDTRPLHVLIVWMRGEPDDTYESARRQATLARDKRIRHFWDGDDLLGAVVATRLQRPGLIAWDIYLSFRAGACWDGELPAPAEWVHQMGDEAWVDDEHHAQPADLGDRLRLVLDAAAS
jgi:hypothetical protein